MPQLAFDAPTVTSMSSRDEIYSEGIRTRVPVSLFSLVTAPNGRPAECIGWMNDIGGKSSVSLTHSARSKSKRRFVRFQSLRRSAQSHQGARVGPQRLCCYE